MSMRPPHLTRTKAPAVRKGGAWEGGSTRRWRKLRQRKLDDEPRCEPCLAQGRAALATQVHHKRPISQGGNRWAWDNLESVCDDCHVVAHGGTPRTGADARGFPTSADHPWNRS